LCFFGSVIDFEFSVSGILSFLAAGAVLDLDDILSCKAVLSSEAGFPTFDGGECRIILWAMIQPFCGIGLSW
jgi:hypothetical protein